MDFDGKVIPRGSSTPYFAGLHHHGQDATSAGYIAILSIDIN